MLNKTCAGIVLVQMLSIVLAEQPVHAQPCDVTEVTKLTADDVAELDQFGWALSLSGDTAIVGAFDFGFDDDSTGSAYIFQRDFGGSDNWGEVVRLTASDAAPFSFFGWTVSLSDDTAIVGAVNDDDPIEGSGSAYIFQRDFGGSDNWGEVVKLGASDAAPGDVFAYAVSLSGDTAIVGALLGRGNDVSDSGSVYVFQRGFGGSDNWGEVVELAASDAAAVDHFGVSVSLYGDTAIVGAAQNDDGGADSGSAYIFQRDVGGSDNWGEVVKLTASDAAAGDWFGFSVSLSGDTAIVGARHNDDDGTDSGSAYIFQRDFGGPDNWGQAIKLTASDAAAGDWFGVSVSLSGDTAIVGAPRGDDDGSNSGSAYIFRRDSGGSDNWGEVAEITASDASSSDELGFTSLSGNIAIVGASGSNDNGSYSGSAYVFELCEECEGDANGDGLVDPLDSGFVLARFGCDVGSGDPGCDAADQNGDGVVDPLDSGFVLARFGECD